MVSIEFSSTTRWFCGRSFLAKLVSLLVLPRVLPSNLLCQSDADDDDESLELMPGTTSGILIQTAVDVCVYVCERGI